VADVPPPPCISQVLDMVYKGTGQPYHKNLHAVIVHNSDQGNHKLALALYREMQRR
jgi:hypothetical protein